MDSIGLWIDERTKNNPWCLDWVAQLRKNNP